MKRRTYIWTVTINKRTHNVESLTFDQEITSKHPSRNPAVPKFSSNPHPTFHRGPRGSFPFVSDREPRNKRKWAGHSRRRREGKVRLAGRQQKGTLYKISKQTKKNHKFLALDDIASGGGAVVSGTTLPPEPSWFGSSLGKPSLYDSSNSQ